MLERSLNGLIKLIRRLTQDLRYACRRLRAAPIFTIFSVVTLALAIGTATAVYSLVRVVAGPPPGIVEADRVVAVSHFPEGSLPMIALSWEDYGDLRARQTAFSSLTAWTFFVPALVADGFSEVATGELVDGDYFRTLGVRAQLGRVIEPRDDRPDAVPTVVISAALWRRAFGGQPDVVGKTMKISGTTFQIIGVAAADFQGLFNGGLTASSVWAPITPAVRALPGMSDRLAPNSRDHRWALVRGRLAPGQTIARANAQIATIAKQLDAEAPIGQEIESSFRAPYRIGRPWGAHPMDTRPMGVPKVLMRATIGVVLGSVIIVLLIACTNLANLMLARNSRRRAEMGVRLALGASRTRLIFESISEPLVLAVAGGIGGLLVARVLIAVLSTALPLGRGFTLQALPRLDLAALGAALIATVLALLVAGIVPALQSARVDLRATLANDGGTSVARWRGRRYLIAAQVTASVLFVAVATLYVGELRRLSRIDTGVDLERLALAQIDFGPQRYGEDRSRQIADAALSQVAARPGVVSASVSSGLPMGLTTTFGASFKDVGGPGSAFAEFVAATPGIFTTLGVRIVRGRAFDARDSATTTRVVVLNETAARQLFPTGDALGRDVTFLRRQAAGEPTPTPRAMTVIGLAADTDARVAGRRDSGVAYLPLAQQYEPRLVLMIRAEDNPAPFVGQLRSAIANVDPGLAVAQIGTGIALAGPDTTFPGIVASSASLLGGMALILAIAGLYGVLSFVVASRTREIGLRIALGAGSGAIRRLVIVEGLSPVLLGIVAGVGLGMIARASMRPQFLRLVPSVDLVLILALPALFIVAGLAACYLPARRASRVDPNVALRTL